MTVGTLSVPRTGLLSLYSTLLYSTSAPPLSLIPKCLSSQVGEIGQGSATRRTGPSAATCGGRGFDMMYKGCRSPCRHLWYLYEPLLTNHFT